MEIFDAKTARKFAKAWKGQPGARVVLSVASAGMEHNAESLEWLGDLGAKERKGYSDAAAILARAASLEPAS